MRRKKDIFSTHHDGGVRLAAVRPRLRQRDVAGAVESTWSTASQQIKTVVDNVIFPAIDLILAVFFLLSNWGRRILTFGRPDSLNGLHRLYSSPVHLHSHRSQLHLGASSGCENLQNRKAVRINIYMGFCLVEDTG